MRVWATLVLSYAKRVHLQHELSVLQRQRSTVVPTMHLELDGHMPSDILGTDHL